MRLATIDIGTNTAQLLVAERDGTELRRLHTAERFVRLGEGVDARGRIGREAQGRLLDALRDHLQEARTYDVDRVSAAGTSALRDAANRDAVLASVRDALGLSVDLLSGTEEATWSFAAACAAFDALSGSCLVVDVGGGSTELIVGTDPTRIRSSPADAIWDHASLNVGCVRLTERCFASQPPAPNAVEAAERSIDEALAAYSLEVGPAPTFIGTAGTATALALVHAGPDSSWDALHGDGFRLSREDVRSWRGRLLGRSVDEIRALHPGAMEGRADVFPMGVLLLDRILAHYNLDDLRVSPYELRHGLALRLLASAPASSS
ncbi:exopolyphosphatase [Salinibacter ruber]|uniref:Ppx/GppA phosphatase family protein n=1 Tax=Salinibacter ruber TaxID=146919 RepID=UPI002168D5C9|nr:exopolyphosphatase [Salinibacter ruber]MCS3702517.1 exopolyphosphatase/guanosine-5'-triphosphate,3'-diphosphate pyrophosphatase [Salinibacter ruber]